MCNQRSATLPEIVAASPNERSRPGPQLVPSSTHHPPVPSGMHHPLRTLLRELFVDPVLRLLRRLRQ
jgi:hypothetical protein